MKFAMDIEIVYMLRTIHLRYCGPTKEQTYGLKTTKEIGEIQLAHG